MEVKRTVVFIKLYLFINLRLRLCAGAAFFPTNSAYGIFAAIAVPLDLPHRNVFLSYNFEANYNLPYTWDIPPVAYGIEEENLSEGRHCANCTSNGNTASEISPEDMTTTTTNPDNDTTTVPNEEGDATTSAPKGDNTRRRRERSLLSRTHFYHILMDKFKRSGYKGEPCLLRLICETNASDLGDINGILGNLIHIIFSPGTSMYEELPLSYYQAELDGENEQCEHYAEECKENLLDLISKPLIDIIQTMTSNK